jgi:hypothetical protein
MPVCCILVCCMLSLFVVLMHTYVQEQERIAVYIQGAGHVNRAMDGDVVVINMLKREGILFLYIHTHINILLLYEQ